MQREMNHQVGSFIPTYLMHCLKETQISLHTPQEGSSGVSDSQVSERRKSRTIQDRQPHSLSLHEEGAINLEAPQSGSSEVSDSQVRGGRKS